MPSNGYHESLMELETPVVRDRRNLHIYTTYLFHIVPPKPMFRKISIRSAFIIKGMLVLTIFRSGCLDMEC